MYYEVRGKGFPIVMIEGLTANSDWWDERLIKELSKIWMVILLDNRGSGRSDNDKDYTLKEMADDTIMLMDVLNIEKKRDYSYLYYYSNTNRFYIINCFQFPVSK